MELLNGLIRELCGFLWSMPMLVLLFGTHLYFSVKTGFVQKKVFAGIKWSLFSGEGSKKTGVSPYSALATALAATIGTGNIIGISTAVALGGPGAVFWCWISGFLGMATCYAECCLAARFRVKREDGSLAGGPMYILDKVLHRRKMAVLFSVFAIMAAFAAGSSVQAHSMAAAIREHAEISPHVIGIAAGMLTGLVIIGGARKIAGVCTWLVPVMGTFFLAGCMVVIWQNRMLLPKTLELMIRSAFSAKSMAGGFTGVAVMTAVRVGMAKGLFTNEAGMGSMPMSAAAADGESFQKQAVISMTGVFWDTIVMCAVTGIAIVSSMLKNPELFAEVSADRLCFAAFSMLPWDGEKMLSVCVVLFAFATIIGWSFYGECAAHYIGGERGTKLFQIAYMVFVYLGAVMSLELVWNLSDLCNAMMTLPNIYCLWKLRRLIGNGKQR